MNEWVKKHKPHPFLLFTRNKWIILDEVFIKNDALLKWSRRGLQIKVIYIWKFLPSTWFWEKEKVGLRMWYSIPFSSWFFHFGSLCEVVDQIRHSHRAQSFLPSATLACIRKESHQWQCHYNSFIIMMSLFHSSENNLLSAWISAVIWGGMRLFESYYPCKQTNWYGGDIYII